MRMLGGDSSFVIGCAVDPTLSCVLFYLSFGLKTRLAMMSFLPQTFLEEEKDPMASKQIDTVYNISGGFRCYNHLC